MAYAVTGDAELGDHGRQRGAGARGGEAARHRRVVAGAAARPLCGGAHGRAVGRCVVGSWRGASGPPGLGAAQISFWQTVLAAATRTAEWKSDLARHFWTEMYLDGEALRDYLSRERTKMRTVLSELGLLSG